MRKFFDREIFYKATIHVAIAAFCASVAWLPFVAQAQSSNPSSNPTRPDLGIPQLPQLPPPEALGQEKRKIPEKEPGPPPKSPEMVLPPVEPVPEDKQKLSTALRIHVRKIQLTGNSVFSEQELSALTKPYENRTITSEELQQLRHQLSQYYIDNGYINSGAVIPDQAIADGVIDIQIVEGKLSSIEITGNDWLSRSYIDKRIARGKGPPLNLNALQERLLLSQQDPLIERINAELRPGLKPGESRLNVRIKEARPYQMGFQVGNDRSPSIGGFGGKVWLTHRNLTGFGDSVFPGLAGPQPNPSDCRALHVQRGHRRFRSHLEQLRTRWKIFRLARSIPMDQAPSASRQPDAFPH